MYGRAWKSRRYSGYTHLGRRELFFFFLSNHDRAVVVQSLRHQLQGQWILGAAGLLDFRPFVLKPYFDLGLVQTELVGQLLSPSLGQVPVLRKLLLQPGQLIAAERRPGPFLVLLLFVLFLRPSRPRT